jgi:DNA polymerase III subunit chi
MAEVGFYHLLRTPLERALPKLLEKAVQRGMRAVVVTGSDERAEHLNAVLWTYDPASFLPHGTASDGHADEQPIYLTDHVTNPNGAALLVLTDGVEMSGADGFERIIDMFDGRDEVAVGSARQRWKALKEAGHQLTYWQQTEGGGWEQKAQG